MNVAVTGLATTAAAKLTGHLLAGRIKPQELAVMQAGVSLLVGLVVARGKAATAVALTTSLPYALKGFGAPDILVQATNTVSPTSLNRSVARLL